jgi:hypothetical protein
MIRFTCRRNGVAVACVSLALLLTGCPGPDRVTEVYDPENWQGNVDPDASPDVQAKQNGMIRLFTAIQQVGVEHVSEEDPNIQFDEPFSEFFEENTVDLFRWDWDGPPEGDRFPVVLILRKDEPGFPQVEKHRTYSVQRSGRKYTIRRSK